MSSIPDSILSPSRRTDILMVRHAEVHNPKDILYGRLPGFRLSQKGIEQAEQTALFLSTRPVEAIYTSPLLRARQTARVLSQYHPKAPVRTTRTLLETRTSHQGSPNSILQPGFSFYEPLKDPGDETMQDIFDRLMRFFRQAIRRHAGGAVVAVSHADPIAILRVGLLGKELTAANMHATIYPARASVNQVTLTQHLPLTLAYFDLAGESSAHAT